MKDMYDMSYYVDTSQVPGSRVAYVQVTSGPMFNEGGRYVHLDWPGGKRRLARVQARAEKKAAKMNRANEMGLA